MSKLIQCICLILFSVGLSANCFARDVHLIWDANTEPDLAGYKIYYNVGSSPANPDGNGSVTGSTAVDVGNVTSTSITGLDPALNYYFGATAYNSGGFESLFSNIVFVNEIIPPTVSITSPTNNQIVTGIATVTVGATDASGVRNVDLYIDGTFFGTVSSAPYSFSWNTTLIAEQGYTLSAKAYDIYGNMAQSADVAVTVVHDIIPPTISITSPADNTYVRGNVALTVNATDNVGVSWVDYYVNNTLKYSTNVAPFSFTWNSSTASDGTYTIFARAHDFSLNAADSSPVHLITDTAPPTVGIGTVTTPTRLIAQNLTGTASDNHGIASVMVQLGAGAPAAATFNAGNGTWSYSLTGMSSGSNVITVTATDLAGNTATAATSILVDVAPPALDVTGPQFTILSTPTISGTVSKTGCSVSVQAGAGAPVTATVNGNNWSCVVSNVVLGDNTITVTAIDPAGNSAVPKTATVTRLRPGPTTSDSNPTVTVADAQKVLNFVLQLETPTAAQFAQSDVAAPGTSTLQPHPDGVLDLYDVSVMLRTAVGLTW